MIQEPYAQSVQDIAKKLKSDLDTGLNKEDVKLRLTVYGTNEIQEDKPKSRVQILLSQFLNPIIYILIVAAFSAFIFDDWLEGVAIIIVILFAVFIGFFMELKAVYSLDALRKIGQIMIRVIRSGKTQRIRASQLVPGDVILLQAGDVIAADARVISEENLSIKESALTGESLPISKKNKILPKDTPITDQLNMLFKGTMVVTGIGKGIVIYTGEKTQLGKIQQMGMDAKKERTPLEKKLRQLSKGLIWLTLFFTVIIIVVGFLQDKDLFLTIETGVALAVAAIPEGLPVVASIALAQGMLRLSKKQVIIKQLEAVQTLGATNIICTDKTGTLTEDKIGVHTLVFENTTLTNVFDKKKGFFKALKGNVAFEKMMAASILCNNADIKNQEAQADFIELALIDFAKHLGYDPVSIRNKNPETLELPFMSDRKLMATAHHNQGAFLIYVKGAFENLVSLCDTILADGKKILFEDKERWFKKLDELASQGLRTLAFAYKESEQEPLLESLLNQLTFIGFIGFIDPARKDVKHTIDIYKKAGIKVVMMTGDHPGTAKKIAQEVGLLEVGAKSDKVLQGKDLKAIKNPDSFTTERLLNASVFARVTPEQKLDLITFHQKNNHIVGMIGDGINDVPALKKADIGIAMGIRGTEAAREVADVILKNDTFTAIEMAIRQGRVVFQNIRQFVVYLLSCNLAEILSVGIAALLNLPSPLLPLQILFLNFVTDVFPALALGLGKGEKDIMNQPPRNPKEPLISKKDRGAVVVYGLSISAAVLGIVIYTHFILKLAPEIINNMAFYTLVLAQLLNVFNMPKHQESFFKNEVTLNPWIWAAILFSTLIIVMAYYTPTIAKALSLFPLSTNQLGTIIVFATGSLVLSQFMKRWIVLKMIFNK